MKRLTKLQQICPYCHSYVEDEKLDSNPSGDCWLGMSMYGTVCYHINHITIKASKKFKFCPMCGRSLSDGELIRREGITVRPAYKL